MFAGSCFANITFSDLFCIFANRSNRRGKSGKQQQMYFQDARLLPGCWICISTLISKFKWFLARLDPFRSWKLHLLWGLSGSVYRCRTKRTKSRMRSTRRNYHSSINGSVASIKDKGWSDARRRLSCSPQNLKLNKCDHNSVYPRS